jgi:hypothetical protein
MAAKVVGGTNVGVRSTGVSDRGISMDVPNRGISAELLFDDK